MAYAPAFHNTSVPSALSLVFCCLCLGLPGSDSKESTCSAGDKGWSPLVRGSPGEGNEATPVFPPGKFQGQGSLAGCSPWGRKEMDATE